jgi:uncharacterized protein
MTATKLEDAMTVVVDDAVAIKGREVLEEMHSLCTSLIYAALVTEDGFEIVGLDGKDIDSHRFASMASSMQALTEAVAKELHIGACDYFIIGSELGHVVQRRVGAHPIVLSALFDSDETLGKAIAISRKSAELLGDALSENAV